MENKLSEYAAARGIALPVAAAPLLDRYFEVLSSANKKVNLTRITDQQEVQIKHFLDSLELLAWQSPLRGPLLDVGSGAGLPGFPLTYRRQFPLVVSRAVARLKVLCELCLPFVTLGGYFVAYKGPEGNVELVEAQNALRELGGRVETIWPYTLPHGMGQRNLIIIKKERPTPEKYPRRAGIPERKPL